MNNDQLTNRKPFSGWRIALIALILASISILAAEIINKWGIGHSLSKIRPEWLMKPSNQSDIETSNFVSTLSVLFTVSLSGILILYCFPHQIRRMEQAFTKSPIGLLRIFLLGLLTNLVISVVGFSSIFSLATTPLTFIFASLYIISAILGMNALAYTTGYWLLAKAGWAKVHPIIMILLGYLLLYPLARLPYVNILVIIIYACLGIGVTIWTKFGSGTSWSLDSLTEEIAE